MAGRPPAESYKKVPYDLRTSKQIERRMIIDGLAKLSRKGFDLPGYQYTGMGSIHFVDFALFRKMLGIQRMLSVEHSNKIVKRIEFNRPYRNIELEFKAIGDVIPDLSKDRRHLLWLDYDFLIDSVVTGDIANAVTVLPIGSIVLVTVDTEPPIEGGTPSRWREYFLENCDPFCDPGWPVSRYGETKLHAINVAILQNAIDSGIVGRPDVRFIPMFNFSYGDGHRMLTIGGMIGGDAERSAVEASGFYDGVYARKSLNTREYVIPKVILTRKEKLYLDAAMPRRKNWMPKEFELEKDKLEAYAEVYQFYPSYAELLL